MDSAPDAQEMSYFDHVQKRSDEKGCLYAWSVFLFLTLPFLICFPSSKRKQNFWMQKKDEVILSISPDIKPKVKGSDFWFFCLDIENGKIFPSL